MGLGAEAAGSAENGGATSRAPPRGAQLRCGCGRGIRTSESRLAVDNAKDNVGGEITVTPGRQTAWRRGTAEQASTARGYVRRAALSRRARFALPATGYLR